MSMVSSPARIAIVQAHVGLREDLGRVLETMGYAVDAFQDAMEIDRTELERFDLLILDLESDHADLLLAEFPAERLILVGDVSGRIALGADIGDCGGYLSKPFCVRELEDTVLACLGRDPSRGNRGSERLDPMLETKDPDLRARLRRVRRWARGYASISLVGEYGTGRRALARAIHGWSGRRVEATATLEGAGLSAVTRADAAHQIEIALFASRGGTLIFVDPFEVGSCAQQCLLEGLRAIDDPASAPRLVSVSTTAIDEITRSGGLVPELAYRLDGLRMSLPALRDRPFDQLQIGRSTLRRVCRELARPTPVLSPETWDALCMEGFPGNRVGLESRLRQLILSGPSAHVGIDTAIAREVSGERSPADEQVAFDLKTLERDAIVRALSHWQGNRTRASESLGISVRTLRNKIRTYGLR